MRIDWIAILRIGLRDLKSGVLLRPNIKRLKFEDTLDDARMAARVEFAL